MSTTDWKRMLRALPKGLTFTEAAQRLGTDYQQTRLAIQRHNYSATDGRRYSQNRIRRLAPEQVDWKMSNIDIAREFGVSRERVRVLRDRLGKPFVESRGRKASV